MPEDAPEQFTQDLQLPPCLFGLFSVIRLAYAHHVRRHRACPASTPWYVKTHVTFSDALATVRRQLWAITVFGTSRYAREYEKLSPGLRNQLLDQLSRAA